MANFFWNILYKSHGNKTQRNGTITLIKMVEKRGKSGLNLHVVVNILESSTTFWKSRYEGGLWIDKTYCALYKVKEHSQSLFIIAEYVKWNAI